MKTGGVLTGRVVFIFNTEGIGKVQKINFFNIAGSVRYVCTE